MRPHLVVANHDLTNYIVDGSYSIDTNDSYESWQDGNFREHRIVVASKVKGSVEILCSNHDNTISLSDLLAYFQSATTNSVVTLGVYVPNTNSFELIECYVDMKASKHIKEPNGNFVDVIKIEIQER